MRNRFMLMGLVACLAGVVSCGGSGLGEVQVLKGKVTITSGDKTSTVSRGAKGSLRCGDTIVTDEGSHALVRAGKQVWVLGEESGVRIELASSITDNGPRKVTLTKGSCTFRVPEGDEQKLHKLHIVCDQCSAATKGGTFSIEQKAGAGDTVSCLKGHVDLFPASAELVGGILPDGKGVKNPKQVPSPMATVEEEKQFVVTSGGPGKAQPIPEDQLKTLQENARK